METRSPQPVLGATDRKQIQAEYQAAYALLSPQNKRYDDAAKAFTAFLKKYPNDELAPECPVLAG